MKISVCGKGGSGKSVVAVLLANAMRRRGFSVLVVDSDESNSSLYRMLGFKSAPTPLMELVGGKRTVQRAMMSMFSSEGSEPEMNVMKQSHIQVGDIPSEYIRGKNGLSLVCIGKIHQSLEGCACPMGVVSREFLGKLHLEEKDVAIVDMEAGVEHFGRGVETSIDAVIVVVEPSFESLQLAGRISSLTKGIGLSNVWAVTNKVTSALTARQLEGELRKKDIRVAGYIRYDSAVFDAGFKGQTVKGRQAARDMERILDVLGDWLALDSPAGEEVETAAT